ncbi:phage holin family protein [Bacteroides fragilis]
MGNFSIAGQVVDSFVWFRYFACTALMVREALSIIENVEEICPGFFPKAIINKLKGFDNVSGKRE